MSSSNRTAVVERKTRETDIGVSVDLDGTGETKIETPIGFLSHMLEALGRHALIDLEVRVAGRSGHLRGVRALLDREPQVGLRTRLAARDGLAHRRLQRIPTHRFRISF